jgi:hypothetical protein
MEFSANFQGIPKIIPWNSEIDRAVIPIYISPSIFFIYIQEGGNQQSKSR